MNKSSKNNQTRQAKVNNKTKQTSLKNAKIENKNAKTTPKSINFNTKTKNETNLNTKPIPSNTPNKTEIRQQQTNTSTPAQPTSKAAKKHKVLSLIIFIGGTIIVGILATLLGGKMKEEYLKPPLYPPDWFFSVAWLVLYVMLGISAYLAFKSVEENKKRRDDTIWFCVHLFLNFMWPLFFFRLALLIFSCVWLLFVVITAIIITYRYYRANIASGIMFTIYTLWLIFALYLNLAITMLNLI